MKEIGLLTKGKLSKWQQDRTKQNKPKPKNSPNSPASIYLKEKGYRLLGVLPPQLCETVFKFWVWR